MGPCVVVFLHHKLFQPLIHTEEDVSDAYLSGNEAAGDC